MSDTILPAYMVVQLNVKDHDKYRRRYVLHVDGMLKRIGAEAVAVSPSPKVLEGKWDGNWTVVIRFPSMAAAEAWYESAEYQPFKELRINELTNGGTVVLIEGFDLAALGI